MIYVIHPNVRQYQCFVLNSKEARNKLGKDTLFHFDQRPQRYADIWQTMAIEFAKLSGGKKGDIPDITLRNGRLFLSEHAHSALQKLLTPCGEFLPVTFKGGTGYLFNVLTLAESVDGLDTKLSTKNEYRELQSLAFHESKVESFAVFRTAFDNYMGVYCNQGFQKAVQAAGLTGITFGEDLGSEFPPDLNAASPTVQ